jgi:hypothetical protein
MNRVLHAGPTRSFGPGLREVLWRLLLLVCGVVAVAAFALTLMLPGMYSPHRLNAKQVPQVMLVPSSRVRTADHGVVWCQTRQAVFIC